MRYVLLVLLILGTQSLWADEKQTTPDFSSYEDSEQFNTYLNFQTNISLNSKSSNIVKISTFPEGYDFALQYCVSKKGQATDSILGHNRAPMETNCRQLSESDLKNLQTAIQDLPTDNTLPPINRLIIVSYYDKTNWITGSYDSENLPNAMHQIYNIVGEIQIPGSKSIKNDRELVLTPSPYSAGSPYGFCVTIRHLKSHKDTATASNSICPFNYPTLCEPYMIAKWNSAGTYVAFNLRDTRHFSDVFVYQIKSSSITSIDIPDYWSTAWKILGKHAGFYGGSETPIRWTNNHTLIMRSKGKLRDLSDFDFLVTIELAGEKASIRSVTLNK